MNKATPLALPLLCVAALTLSTPGLFAKEVKKKPPRTVAHSVVSPLYQRERLEDGQWKPETYALGIGKLIDPTEKDESLIALSQEELANHIATALAEENYVPETDPQKTDLLIVLNWGKTIPHHDGFRNVAIDEMANAMNSINSINSDIGSDGSLTAEQSSEMSQSIGELETMLLLQDMAERARRKANEYNAQLLGYAPTLVDYYSMGPILGPQRNILNDLEAEIETERYFVILQAYDFRKLVESKEKNLLWITRFSIRARGRSFDEEFANMARAASSLFGNESGRLKRNLLPGDVSMGELEVVDVMEDEAEIEE
ncbi:hypothetical protein [Pelagicoccus sp. SDUM812003]|uniref:hypothetical protein n=1 Tax=Pelagicoccus sp. SDUM812003 TaxID=3041267 RepID=UPI00280F6E02|nr:hypothetical protein [Pelagicoccus sp. SDUM812003]MDQ8203520.1 hypothetical protein [Pelagicoccus sp. SDUM812003]